MAQLILAQKDKNIFSAAGRFISDLVADEEEALQGAGTSLPKPSMKTKIAGIICAMCSENTG